MEIGEWSVSTSFMFHPEGAIFGPSLNYNGKNGDFGFSALRGNAPVTGKFGWEPQVTARAKYKNWSYGINYYGGPRSQTTGTIAWSDDTWSAGMSNDMFVGQGEDKYRTAGGSISYKDYSIGFKLWTGKPKPGGVTKKNGGLRGSTYPRANT